MKVFISKKIKKKFPSINFDELDSFIDEYEKRHYYSLESKIDGKDFVRNYLMLLFCILKRSNDLFKGAISCINNKHITITFLAVRAHMETTGSIASFLLKMRNYYNRIISLEELDNFLLKLHLGRKHYSGESKDDLKIDPIHVLDLIRAVDKVFFEKNIDSEIYSKLFVDEYEWLSEFCHPNHFGQIIGVVQEGKKTIFNQKHELKIEEIRPPINTLKISCLLFFHMYDNCFSLIKENEEMPNLVKYERNLKHLWRMILNRS